MKISSFDIFDTCLVRKCGTPENFLDVLSLRAFVHEPSEWARQEFVAARHLAEQELWNKNPYYTLQDIWKQFEWSHPLLKDKEELCQIELDTEQSILVPVLPMRDKVNECRKRGDKIIFISDMYLSSGFLIEMMREQGFYQDGDALYVSCECHAAKYNGELFQYVKEKEGLKSFRHWHHYGDNKIGDYKGPKKFGIHGRLITHKYTPYQEQWIKTDYSEKRTKSKVAGICRAIRLSVEHNTHTDFVLDIVAPLYASFVWRIMVDAENNGIRKLFFCARDAYLLYLVALKYQKHFPSLGLEYLYISQQALYYGNTEGRLRYFEQIGLTSRTDNVAIVDVRSSGHTLFSINQEVQAFGYLPVRGYFFEIYCNKGDMTYRSNNYYAAINTGYHPLSFAMQKITNCWHLYEMFFSIHDSERTIDYRIEKGISKPIFDIKNQSEKESHADSIITNRSHWKQVHEMLVLKFVEYIQDLGMENDADEIYTNVAIPTLCQFTMYPPKRYLIALEDFYVYSKKRDCYVPYARRENLSQLIRYKCRSCAWRRGMLFASIPDVIIKILLSKAENN